jgi:myosin heavy subunit
VNATLQLRRLEFCSQSYKESVLQSYEESLQPQAELPPHVYAVAASPRTSA